MSKANLDFAYRMVDHTIAIKGIAAFYNLKPEDEAKLLKRLEGNYEVDCTLSNHKSTIINTMFHQEDININNKDRIPYEAKMLKLFDKISESGKAIVFTNCEFLKPKSEEFFEELNQNNIAVFLLSKHSTFESKLRTWDISKKNKVMEVDLSIN